MKASVVATALLLPSATCVHVSMKHAMYPDPNAASVTISTKQYQQLVDAIHASLKIDEHDQAIPIDGFHYNRQDAFFKAKGTYHCLNTCNSWVGRKLQAAEVTTPWLSPLPKTAHWYFSAE